MIKILLLELTNENAIMMFRADSYGQLQAPRQTPVLLTISIN
jgi:hypothetical protein